MKTIGIDIDNTITCTSEKIKECLALYAPDYTDYHNLPKPQLIEFLTMYQEYIHNNCELKPGIKEAFTYFQQKGYKIIIVTAREESIASPNEEALTKEYLKKHNLEYSKIYFACHKKGKIAKDNNIELFIDDNETVLDDIHKYNIECLKISSYLNSKYKTFTNWHDIIEYIKLREE